MKLTLLYGIASLSAAHGDRTLPMDELRAVVVRNHVALTVESRIPQLAAQARRGAGAPRTTPSRSAARP